jgi:hypothetical protein
MANILYNDHLIVSYPVLDENNQKLETKSSDHIDVR